MNFTRNLWLAAVLAVTAAAYWGTARSGHDWGGDFSMYIIHARNLAEGKPYSAEGFVNAPGLGNHHPVAYPPVFPLVLTPVFARWGLDYDALKCVPRLMMLGAMIAFYFLGRGWGLSSAASALSGLAVALSWSSLYVKEVVVSDTTYMFFCGAALLVWHVLREKELDVSHPITAAAMLTLALMLAYGTRSAGIVLVVAIAAEELWRERRLRRFNIAWGLIMASALIAYTLFIYDNKSYGESFQFSPRMYLSNAITYLKAFARFWTPVPAWIRMPVGVAAFVLAAAGFWIRLREEVRAPELYAAGSIALLVAYLGDGVNSGDGRYLLAVAPLLFLYMAVALRRLPRIASAAAIALMIVVSAWNVSAVPRGPVTEGVKLPQFQGAAEFLRTLPRDSVVASWNPRVYSLYTRLRGTHWPHTDNIEEFERIVAPTHVTHYVVDKAMTHEPWLENYLKQRADKLDLIFQNDRIMVYRVR